MTLAWDPSPGSDIAGYRLYEGAASRTYTNVIDAGNATNGTFSSLVSGATYFFAATAYDTNGLESDYSAKSVTLSPANQQSPVIALTSPANGAAYTAPATITSAASVTANGHTITQVQFYNGATLLGTVAAAPYNFSWNNVSAGTYSLSAKAVYDSGSTVPRLRQWRSDRRGGDTRAGLTFAADSGTYHRPVRGYNGSLSQSVRRVLRTAGKLSILSTSPMRAIISFPLWSSAP